jgi:zinc protease
MSAKPSSRIVASAGLLQQLLLVCLLPCATWLLPMAAAAAATADVLPGQINEVRQVEGITEYALPNGLQLLLVPDASKPSTTVNLTYRVGSRHESYGETGMAHLLEHLIFKGSPAFPGVQAELGRRGLRYNGSTSYDRTNYFATFSASAENLRWYLQWSADAMVNSHIARSDLDSEMTVVRNELEMGENNPGRVLFQRLLATMYDWHNYGKSTIGARSDVENVDIARLQAFYRLHYQPDNATLIVSGRFEPAQVLAWVAQYFGPIPRPARTVPPTYTLEAAQDGERVVRVQRVGGTPILYMGFHIPPGAHPDFAALALLGQVLGDAPAGRLHKALVERKLAAAAFAYPLALAEPGALVVGVQLPAGGQLEPARTAMAAVLDGLARQPVTAQELERARTQWLNGWEQAHADPEQVGVNLSEAIALGDWRMFFKQRDQIRAVTLADLQRVAGQYLVPVNRSVALYEPVAGPQRAPAPARVDVAGLLQNYSGSAAADEVEAFDATPANLDARTQTSQLASGLRVALLPKPTRGRAVQARLALHYGDAPSLFGQEMAALLTAALLDKGTVGAGGKGPAALSRQQIADRLDALRAQVGFSASGQTLNVSITTVREHLPAVVELLGTLLRQPSFPPEALEEVRAQYAAYLAQQRQEPEALVANALDRLGNPYRRGDIRYESTFDEAAADLRAVTRAQLQQFHRRFYSAANGEFSAVGDFEAAAVQQALTRALGPWKQPAAGPRAYQRVPRPLVALPQPAPRLQISTPDKANASFQAVLPLPLNDAHVDYPALLLANHIFGAGSTGRLWLRIRESEGLSYGVGSGVRWSQTDLHSRWVAGGSFAPGNLARMEAAWQQELARSLAEGFTQAELDEARTALLNLRRLGRAQDASVAGALLANTHLGRRFATSQQVDEKLAALTLDQVNAAWRRYIDPARIATAWGGDFKPAAP